MTTWSQYVSGGVITDFRVDHDEMPPSNRPERAMFNRSAEPVGMCAVENEDTITLLSLPQTGLKYGTQAVCLFKHQLKQMSEDPANNFLACAQPKTNPIVDDTINGRFIKLTFQFGERTQTAFVPYMDILWVLRETSVSNPVYQIRHSDKSKLPPLANYNTLMQCNTTFQREWISRLRRLRLM